MSTADGKPYCTVCMEKEDFEVLEFFPESWVNDDRRSWQGTIRRNRRIPPSVLLRCGACGQECKSNVGPGWRPE